MKALNKNQEAQRMEHVEALNKAHEFVTVKYSALVSAMEEYNDSLSKYNDVVGDVEAWRDEIVADMQTYMDEKSERWSDSENGQAYGDWKDTWESTDFQKLDALEIPEEPEIEDFITEVQDLPAEPG